MNTNIIISLLLVAAAFAESSSLHKNPDCNKKDYRPSNAPVSCINVGAACAILGEGYKVLSIMNELEYIYAANEIGRLMSGRDAWTSGQRRNSTGSGDCSDITEEWVWTGADNVTIDPTLLALVEFLPQPGQNYIYFHPEQNDGISWQGATEQMCREQRKFAICEKCIE